MTDSAWRAFSEQALKLLRAWIPPAFPLALLIIALKVGVIYVFAAKVPETSPAQRLVEPLTVLVFGEIVLVSLLVMGILLWRAVRDEL